MRSHFPILNTVIQYAYFLTIKTLQKYEKIFSQKVLLLLFYLKANTKDYEVIHYSSTDFYIFHVCL